MEPAERVRVPPELLDVPALLRPVLRGLPDLEL